MEFYETQKLKENWGDKPCDHPQVEKIFYYGAFLTVYGCVQCGAEISIAQKLEMDRERKAQRAEKSIH